jgi:hypothetical protein
MMVVLPETILVQAIYQARSWFDFVLYYDLLNGLRPPQHNQQSQNPHLWHRPANWSE